MRFAGLSDAAEVKKETPEENSSQEEGQEENKAGSILLCPFFRDRPGL